MRLVQLCGAHLGARAHICAFFRTVEEQNHALLPFIRDGLAAGQKVVHTIDPTRREEQIEHFAAAGIDFAIAHQHGCLELRTWTETHLVEPLFDADNTLARFQQIASTSAQQGFPLTRFVTHMEWALGGILPTADLLAYEAQANEIWLRGDAVVNPVICVYDINRFSADLLVDVMRTHPLTLIGGVLQENPYFVPPERFVRERRRGL